MIFRSGYTSIDVQLYLQRERAQGMDEL